MAGVERTLTYFKSCYVVLKKIFVLIHLVLCFLRVSQKPVVISVNSISLLSLPIEDYVYSNVRTETLYIVWLNCELKNMK